jgi:uncharacterized coiled-coil protein SlyX
MRKLKYNIWIILFLTALMAKAQEYEKPVQEFNVKKGATIKIKASYQEIEIEEWNKNKVSIQGIFRAEGLSKNEARSVFDQWNINSMKEGNTVEINSKSYGFGDSYFFLNNNKYLGPLDFEINDLNTVVGVELDSVFFMPSIEEFPDLDYDFNFDFGVDTITFDFEKFLSDKEYMKEWQEKNKAQFKKLEKELKAHKKYAEQNTLQAEKMAQINQARLEKMAAANEKRVKELEKRNAKRQKLIEERNKKLAKRQKEMMVLREQRLNEIMKKRSKINVKKILRIKVPKGAKLEMDVDNCRIVTKK